MTLKVNKKEFIADYDTLSQKEMINKYGITAPTIRKLVSKYRKPKKRGRKSKIELV